MASDGPSMGNADPDGRPPRLPEAEGSMRTMALAAAGIAAVVMGGVYVMGRHHPTVVPVISPDAAPLRVRPADPGGMQVAGLDDQDGPGEGADKLAPPPEMPDPQKLARQQSTEAPPTPAPTISTPAPAVPAPAAHAPADHAPAMPTPAPPVPAAPAGRPPDRAVAPATAAPPAPPPRQAEAGRTEVQLAALDSEAAARQAWARLAARMPQLLANRTPAITRFDRDGRVFWRLRVGGFASIAAATAFCGQLRAQGASCTIARF